MSLWVSPSQRDGAQPYGCAPLLTQLRRALMTGYFLPRHVHFCSRGSSFVFLDLRRDQYTLVNGNGAIALISLISDANPPCSADRASDDLMELVRYGLLTTNAKAGKPVTPTFAPVALEQLLEADQIAGAPVRAHHVWRFFVACTIATLQLRWCRLESLVNLVTARKARVRTEDPIDLARARELTAIFERLRFFFPRKYLCLFDSVALLTFLSAYRVHPTWVFAVKLEPWAAHCWVQHSGVLFNEGVEEAANYTPVMTV